MKISKNSVFINSFDAICCAGEEPQKIFKNICNKVDVISSCANYIENASVALGKIDSIIPVDSLLIQKCRNVLNNSNLKNFDKTLLVVGTSVGGMHTTEEVFFKDKNYKNVNYKLHSIAAIAFKLKKHFSFYDDISFSTACTSSANALGYAKEVIEKGIYENVLVVGIDTLSYTTVHGFYSLGVLSSKPCTPFEQDRLGMNVAEGIAVLLLQNIKTTNSIELCGVGYSSDAHHMTQPHPQGEGAKKAMQNAIKDANIEIDKIDYINAHGTGTVANDSSELNAISSLFLENKPYVSSTKSFTGHTLGAAGAIEAVISCMAIKNGVIPPSKDLKSIENSSILYSNVPIDKEIKYVLSNSFAFGGNNTSLVFGRCDEN